MKNKTLPIAFLSSAGFPVACEKVEPTAQKDEFVKAVVGPRLQALLDQAVKSTQQLFEASNAARTNNERGVKVVPQRPSPPWQSGARKSASCPPQNRTLNAFRHTITKKSSLN